MGQNTLRHTLLRTYLIEGKLSSNLDYLDKGIKFEFDDKCYFIQGRLTHHDMDTAALIGAINCQQCFNLHAGCPFDRKMHGIYINTFGKHIYPGNRGALDIRNPLRTFGQSSQCCPPNYYLLNGYEKEAVQNYNKQIMETDMSAPVSTKENNKNQVSKLIFKSCQKYS